MGRPLRRRKLGGELRQCFTARGKPKRLFPNEKEARTFTRTQGRAVFKVYECEFHDGYHIARIR